MKFWKMHGLGNDYIVIDNRDEKIREEETSKLSRKICERRFSVGADGLLLLYDSTVADIKTRIFNVDGSEAEMCGNGIRCVAKYCYENNIVKKDRITVETLAGIKKMWLIIRDNEVKMVRVNMGKPIFKRSRIPMLGRGVCINEDLEIEEGKFKITCLSIGNPHCVIFVDDVENFPVHKVGPKIENHKIFPKRTNVEFVQVLDKNELCVRTWERGCRETLACGTGACASAVAGNLLRKINKKSLVHLLGGDLEIECSGNVLMTGSVEKVFEGILFW